MKGPVTYAIAALLLGIIKEDNLTLKCLPLAISCVDKSIKKIGTSIKRTIERKLCKVDNTSELFCKIESLYNDDTNVSLGPACSFAEIDAACTAGPRV